MKREIQLIIGFALGALLFGLVGGAMAVRLGSVETVQRSAAGSAILGTAFTFQGQLKDGAAPANDQFDLRFRLFDAAVGPSQVGSTITSQNETVTDGLFTVALDFGPVYDGTALWLEVAVRPGASIGAFDVLNPRNPLTATPYAIHALSAWNVNGNSGADPGANFLGTTDDTGLTMKVDNTVALRLEPAFSSSFGPRPNVIGGSDTNSAAPGVVGVAIGGGSGNTGGSSMTTVGGGLDNTSGGEYGTIAGGHGNIIFDTTTHGVIGGGSSNVISDTAWAATIGGGNGNTASATQATVGGGDGNTAGGFLSTVGGGQDNIANGTRATIAGGYLNVASNQSVTVGGGVFNRASGEVSTIAGGGGNKASNTGATVAGGSGNTASGDRSSVGGGGSNTASNSYSIVAGGQFNIASGSFSTVSGGEDNEAIASLSTVSGGQSNDTRELASTVSGGVFNSGRGSLSTIGGGAFNITLGESSVVGGGQQNVARGDFSTVGGGRENTVSGYQSTVSGGNNNLISSTVNYGTIGGGIQNIITGTGSAVTIGGGINNTASDSGATVAGGQSNSASGQSATVGGGNGNEASDTRSTIGGGQGNIASSDSATVSGGFDNSAIDPRATVGGGQDNSAQGDSTTIAGGYNNTASGNWATIGGGREITASGNYAAIAGGNLNVIASGSFGAIPGGQENYVGSSYGLAAGFRARVEHIGAYVWADSTGSVFTSTASNQYLIRAAGGVGIGTNSPSQPLEMASGAHVTAGGAWTNASSQEIKENFEQLDAQAVLEEVAALPVTRWNYRETPGVTNLGPTAEAFQAAFDLGDGRYISTVDADGVALAAIQGLYDISQQQEAVIADLQAQNDELNARLTSLEEAAGMKQDSGPRLGISWLPLLLLAVPLLVVYAGHKRSKEGPAQ